MRHGACLDGTLGKGFWIFSRCGVFISPLFSLFSLYPDKYVSTTTITTTPTTTTILEPRLFVDCTLLEVSNLS